MDLRDHLNLVYNHNYNGWMAIYRGPNGPCLKNGMPVLVRETHPSDGMSPEEISGQETRRTVDIPLTRRMIDEERKRGSAVITGTPTVGVLSRAK